MGEFGGRCRKVCLGVERSRRRRVVGHPLPTL